MRKFSLLLVLAALLLSPISVFAEKDLPLNKQSMGGFSGPVSGAMADTVAKALELQDDAPVVLTGNITSQVAGKKDKFMFRDSTGEILVDIDKKAFRGQTVTPQDTVRLSGKMDKDWGKDPKIEVKNIEILKQ